MVRPTQTTTTQASDTMIAPIVACTCTRNPRPDKECYVRHFVRQTSGRQQISHTMPGNNWYSTVARDRSIYGIVLWTWTICVIGLVIPIKRTTPLELNCIVNLMKRDFFFFDIFINLYDPFFLILKLWNERKDIII